MRIKLERMTYILPNKTKKTTLGFTLVETLVAISILSVSVLAAFTAVQSALQKSQLTKDQTTAFYLVQEGMEYIRNVRDTNAIASLGNPAIGWLHGFAEVGNACAFNNSCEFDMQGILRACSSAGSCSSLYQDASGLFGYTTGVGWTPTKFKREISLQEVVAGREIRATVKVIWGNNSFQVQQLFFNNR